MQLKSNIKKRILATVLDYGLFYTATIAYIMYIGQETDYGIYVIQGLLTLPIIIAWFIYFVLIEGFNQATLGHQALNLAVKTTKGKNISVSESLKRHLLDPIDILILGIPALISILNSDKSQRIGDMWAGTVIIDLNDEAHG